MKCTDKEWDTCQVEKMGCNGCYYNETKSFNKNIEKDTKISFPLINSQEIDNIDNFQDDLVKIISKAAVHDKDLLIAQRIIINQQKEIEKQKKENIDLKELYVRVAKHQEKIGHTELAEYMLAQIQAIPTFTTWEEYTTWVSKDDLRKILDKYAKKEIEFSPELYKELRQLLEEKWNAN